MEIGLLISAIALGFASGFHCIGMCGPIALSMGLTKKQAANFYLQNLTYQFGRIFTYSLLGALLGIIGQGFEMAGFQKYLTIIAGVLLIIMAVFSFGGKDFASKIPFLSKFLYSVKLNLGRLLQKADYRSRFTTGVLNGFLPCGMVYMALTASLAGGGIWQGAVYMALFGLGTLPFMFAIVLAGNLMNQAFRVKVLKAVPVIMIILGGLFILRGLELGIPYVSPKAEAMTISTDHNGAVNCH
ncbi:cytochrome C biogenesis protein [Chryseobacterium lactis]|uniref:Cytochrome C biogenesis protein n=1 Tax=Chryseobacterium lactis TaxID=1241981 RepID=A0A3G6RSX9_CHRLC|nr:sulfite exporter TauE/SafE family protein [Chryseobacterium lactis]AZA81106.1 sulfite exporter TauE/SafE family protein [Chryseobacterium lactis]AZB06107.1 sulfite exporter TauE/SafE family protein [Chryseobacterium lactis]PNW14957.1 cytochrome C biogenesis protein [Chryseobacterium lactis]